MSRSPCHSTPSQSNIQVSYLLTRLSYSIGVEIRTAMAAERIRDGLPPITLVNASGNATTALFGRTTPHDCFANVFSVYLRVQSHGQWVRTPRGMRTDWQQFEERNGTGWLLYRKSRYRFDIFSSSYLVFILTMSYDAFYSVTM